MRLRQHHLEELYDVRVPQLPQKVDLQLEVLWDAVRPLRILVVHLRAHMNEMSRSRSEDGCAHELRLSRHLDSDFWWYRPVGEVTLTWSALDDCCLTTLAELFEESVARGEGRR